MEVHVVRGNPVRGPLGPSQPREGVERQVPHSIGKPGGLDQPPHLSPAPRMPAPTRSPVPMTVPGAVAVPVPSVVVVPMTVPGAVVMPMTVPSGGSGFGLSGRTEAVREVLRV